MRGKIGTGGYACIYRNIKIRVNSDYYVCYRALNDGYKEVVVKVSNIKNCDGSTNPQLVMEPKLMKMLSQASDLVAKVDNYEVKEDMVMMSMEIGQETLLDVIKR